MSIQEAFLYTMCGTAAVCALLIAVDCYRRACLWTRFVKCMDNEKSALVILQIAERTKGVQS